MASNTNKKNLTHKTKSPLFTKWYDIDSYKKHKNDRLEKENIKEWYFKILLFSSDNFSYMYMKYFQHLYITPVI